MRTASQQTSIDDTFMTLGSANLNTRSMASDSELNILHDHPEVLRPASESLWDLHTQNQFADGGRIADMPLDKPTRHVSHHDHQAAHYCH